MSQLRIVKESLKNLGKQAKKRLGQHFLIDRSFLRTISTAAELCFDDTVIEVGSGLGVLTEELLNRTGHVIAVEADGVLAQNLSRLTGLTVINDDILKTTPDELLDKTVTSYKVVANLPYNIASQVLRHFLEASIQPTIMVVMIQREVAQNIVAKPPDMNLIAVSVHPHPP